MGLERGSQGTDVTEPSAKQLDLVDPGRLPGRGEWCWLDRWGWTHREERGDIHKGNQTQESRKARRDTCPEGLLGEMKAHRVGPTLELASEEVEPFPQQFLSKCCNGGVSGRAWRALAQ